MLESRTHCPMRRSQDCDSILLSIACLICANAVAIATMAVIPCSSPPLHAKEMCNLIGFLHPLPRQIQSTWHQNEVKTRLRLPRCYALGSKPQKLHSAFMALRGHLLTLLFIARKRST
mmetsp:Transcript_176175/g.559866  ORF Transcript_176175/g.559866 Transcript_176175/m.559866 type:complete len:118 (+) Transcript_176175:35-388(+)